jgi:hydroxymethylbilane synthase
MAAFGQISADTLTIKGMVAEIDGSVMHMETFSGPAEEGEAIGDRLALALIEKGADRIIERLIQEGH